MARRPIDGSQITAQLQDIGSKSRLTAPLRQKVHLDKMEDIDDIEFNDSEHNRLISAISKLDKTQHIKVPTRNEPTNLNSEFNLIKNSNRLDLDNVVRVLENTAHHVQISKKLKKTQDASNVLPKPLEKPQVERIKRATGYEQAKKKISRWDPVVARSRTVDYVSFPIKHVSQKLQPTKDFLSKLKLKSPLEIELAEVDPPAIVEEEDNEDEKTYPMSYEEMVEHRQHLAKLRAQQSFKAAKAKRQSKIKSKKYHRVLKKEKLKQELKEFEELQKTDPEEALKRLESLEKARALERHTLRHKSTGKWAKNKLVRAKYDKEVRQELAEQLAVSRGLTAKTQNYASSDDEADANFVNPDLTLSLDPLNPWMLKRSDKSNVDAEFDFRYKKYVKDRMFRNKAADSDSESEHEIIQDNTVACGASNKDNISLKNAVEGFIHNNKANVSVPNNTNMSINNITNKKEVKVILKPKTKTNTALEKENVKIVATTNWVVEMVDESDVISQSNNDISDVFESLETVIKGKVEKKLNNLRNKINKLEKKRNHADKGETGKQEVDNLEYLSLKNKKLKPIIDEQLIESTSKTPSEQIVEKSKLDISIAVGLADNQISSEANIDPSRFIQAKPKFLNSALPGTENDFDQLDDDEQVVPKVNIEEVFEEDDVVASFRHEKEEEAKKNQPQDIDLSLPGWGSWGGKGVKAPKRKRNRFILKAPPKMPRRDDNKGDIIIKEFKEPKLATHKVKEVPFPFISVKEYEASIRAPIGNTFIPERAHKLLIRPSVITKAGTIIEPMDEEELLVAKHRNFKNASVLKLLGKK